MAESGPAKLTENEMSRREVLLASALLGTAAFAYAATPRTRVDLVGNSRLENLVPTQIGSWNFLSKSGLVVPPEDQLSDKLYDQLLTRVYISDVRPPVMLLIAQSPVQDGTLQVHRPEVCYPFGGYRLSGSRVYAINLPALGQTLPTRMFTATSDARTEQLLYWTRIGLDLPTSWFEQRLAVAKANFRGRIPDAVLVRVSTVSQNMQGSMPILGEFTRSLVQALAPQGRLALLGPS